MAPQSLYRRYRPRRFGEVRGQDHVVGALRNAVRGGTEGHAYLFSGPRGTGKTSTARILAKALNCEDLRDGEPCCECSACIEIEGGRSFDLFELDAASNNGVDNIRELVERAAVGSPGRTKVYILDEVHMLTAAASNALLKTLEEPPEHVCFVLATTDPQKVLPTIRSRTQHYEFQLLSAHELTDYVRWIAQDAPLDLDEESIAYVVRQGRGSARDTLSALDQVVAAGGVVTRVAPVDQLLQALADRSSGGAVLAVSDALSLGHDPRVLADSLLAELRDAFLLSLGVEVPHLVDADSERLGEWAHTLGTPALTRAMEAVGAATVDMRQAADPRVPLEVALVRLCSSDSGAAAGPSLTGPGDAPDGAVIAQLVRRIDALEAALADGGGRAAAATAGRAASTASPSARPEPAAADRAAAAAPAESASGGAASGGSASGGDVGADAGAGAVESSGDGPARARAALGALRKSKAEAATSPSGTSAAPPTAPPTTRPSTAPSSAPARPSAPPKAPSTERSAAPDVGASPAARSGGSVPAAPGPRPPAGDAPVAGAAGTGPLAVDGSASAEPVDDRPAPAPTGSSAGPDLDALALAFGEVVVPQLKGMAKAIYGAGRFVAVGPAGAVFALDNAPTVERAERFRSDVEAALSQHLGTPVTLVLIDGTDPNALDDATSATAPAATTEPPRPAAASSPAPEVGDAAPSDAAPSDATPSDGAANPDSESAGTGSDDHTDDDESAIIDVHELEDADVAATGMDKLTKAFPGAVLVDGTDGA